MTYTAIECSAEEKKLVCELDPSSVLLRAMDYDPEAICRYAKEFGATRRKSNKPNLAELLHAELRETAEVERELIREEPDTFAGFSPERIAAAFLPVQ